MKQTTIHIRLSSKEKKEIEIKALAKGCRKPSGQPNITQYLLEIHREVVA